MAEPVAHFPSFDRLGPAEPSTPLVIAVPHAGRSYPPSLIAAAAVPRATLELLEDRFADRLVEGAVEAGVTAYVARNARAWIDLNRDEREVDPAMLAGMPGDAAAVLPTIASPKVRGGLGLIPRRLSGVGELLRTRIDPAEVALRIASDHRPWHRAIGASLAAAQARFGMAILLDCHSMPPLKRELPGQAPRIVIGDRHGRSAARPLVDRLVQVIDSSAIGWRINDPYAGGYALDRHGQPARGIHAIQIEVDRSLYLAADLRSPTTAIDSVIGLVTRCAEALIDAALPSAMAAE